MNRIALRSILFYSVAFATFMHGMSTPSTPNSSAASEEVPGTVKKTAKSKKTAKKVTPKKTQKKEAKIAASSTKKKPAKTPKKKAPVKHADSQVAAIIAKIKDGKLPQVDLGGVGNILQKLGSSIISGDIVGIDSATLGKLPIELSPKKAIALSGTITFLKKPVDCKIIIGKQTNAAGKSTMGFSLDLALSKNLKVKDLTFLNSLGVPSSELGKFSTIDLPQPHIIFSTFDSYTDPETDATINAGLTVQTKTKAANLMSLIRKEINNLTGGHADKLPFISKMSDSAAISFSLVVNFKGSNFQGFKAAIALPMQLGIDIAKLRAQEKRFNPKIKAPFDDLNKPIKAVTGVINSAPLNQIKKITVENFVASIGIENGDFELEFGAELNVTAKNGNRYGMKGTVGLTPSQLAIELQKSPSIKSMSLGSGVSIDNLALATYTDFKLLASTGVPFSGLGLLAEISFPFENDKVAIGLAGKVEISGDFMLMGSVKNLSVTKLAQFHAKMIENLARAVKFDTTALTKAMNQMPKIVIKEGMVYVSTKETTLAGRTFPLGLGVTLETTINNMKSKLAVAGNTSELSFMGYLSKISSPYIVISGAGPDKKHGTGDDGPLIDFQVSASDPLKAKFFASSKVSLPPVKIAGQGDLAMGVASIDAKFTAEVAKLFKAKFDVAFDPRNIPASKVGFDLDSTQRKQFIDKLFTTVQSEVNKAIAKLIPWPASNFIQQRFSFIYTVFAKPVAYFGDSVIPKRIYANVTAKTWSGYFGIEGGTIDLSKFAGLSKKISLSVPKISFSLKDPAKVIAGTAEKISKEILDSVLAALEKALGWATDASTLAAKTAVIHGKKVIDTAKKTGKSIEKAAIQVKKEAEIAAKKAKKAAEDAAKKIGSTAKKVGKEIEKGAKKVAKETKKVVKDVGKGVEKGAKAVADFFGF